MMHLDTIVTDPADLLDEDDAATTLRFVRPIFAFDDMPTDPDATSIYDLRTPPPSHYVGHVRSGARRRRIRDTEQEIAGLRAALVAGWDVAPELAFEERQLATLVLHGAVK